MPKLIVVFQAARVHTGRARRGREVHVPADPTNCKIRGDIYNLINLPLGVLEGARSAHEEI